MVSVAKIGSSLACALVLIGGAPAYGREREHGSPPHGGAEPAMHPGGERPPGEPRQGPHGYQRVTPPQGFPANKISPVSSIIDPATAE